MIRLVYGKNEANSINFVNIVVCQTLTDLKNIGGCYDIRDLKIGGRGRVPVRVVRSEHAHKVWRFFEVRVLHPRSQCYSFRMSLTSSPGRTKKFEFFHWLTKNGCAAEMKITKLYASHFTSGPNGGWRTLQKKAKQMATVPDRSEGIVKVSA